MIGKGKSLTTKINLLLITRTTYIHKLDTLGKFKIFNNKHDIF